MVIKSEVNMAQQRLSPAKVVDLLVDPPKASAAWSPFSLQVIVPPLHLEGYFTYHVLSLRISGRHRLRQVVDGRSLEGWSAPGLTNLAPSNTVGTYDTAGPCSIIALYI